MLAALSPLGKNMGREQNDYPDFSDDNLLESIDFDDLFVGMDMLPGLEMDPGEFCLSGGEADSCEFNNNSTGGILLQDDVVAPPDEKDEIINKRIKSKNSSHLGKRKVKVDWTPELHRRFVQAVEQLGVDKAVPSRILEIMGIGCLTRHNIASHLQKYRSHRKHLLAREAEAANWSHRRQKYAGVSSKRAWVVAPPSMGFPSISSSPPPPPPPSFAHHYRPLHVWGHPSMEPPSYRPSSPHVPHLPAWHQRAPYMPHILPQPRFQIPHVVIPPPHAAMYNAKGSVVTSTGQSCPRPPLDLHPSKESIDAAIEDILSKPSQPLPLGLRPPALDSVMLELHRQGIQKVPPTCF